MSTPGHWLEVFGGEICRVEKIGGGMVARYRKERGLSQRAMAVMLGITDVHLCNVEKGRASPLEVIKRIGKLKNAKVPA